ncbi:MAG: hypothetical protein QM696_05940 [Steroidobacteraceae bacterium]
MRTLPMRTLTLLAGLAAMVAAGAAEPAKRPPPTRASQAWATGPAPAPAPDPAAAPPVAPQPAAEAPAAVTPAAASPRSTASLEPAVDTSAPARPASPPSAASAAVAPATGTAGVRDRLELGTTQITGNRELPRVMYVVPWKRADLGDLTGRPVNSLLDEVLEPVDRDVFRRQNRYYQALQPDTGR